MTAVVRHIGWLRTAAVGGQLLAGALVLHRGEPITAAEYAAVCAAMAVQTAALTTVWRAAEADRDRTDRNLRAAAAARAYQRRLAARHESEMMT